MKAPHEVEPLDALAWLASADLAEEAGGDEEADRRRTIARCLRRAERGQLRLRTPFAVRLLRLVGDRPEFGNVVDARPATHAPTESRWHWYHSNGWLRVLHHPEGVIARGTVVVGIERLNDQADASPDGSDRMVAFIHPEDAPLLCDPWLGVLGQ